MTAPWLIAGALLAALLRAPAAANPAPAAPGAQEPVTLDRVIAIINDDVLLESDVEEEMHLAVLQPYAISAGSSARQRAAERLINRTLILQAMREQQPPPPEPSAAEVRQRVDELRKQIPACARYHCETEEGWRRFLADNKYTEEEVEARWRERLRILQFIEARFRAGIRVPQAEIENYYHQTLVPQLQKENAQPPALDSIAPRIGEILLQQKVNALLQDWLKGLRQQGNVVILDPAYGQILSGDDDGGGTE